MNKSKHFHKLGELCQVAGFSKQAHAAYVNRRINDIALYDLVQNIVDQTREMHPQMGLKKMYYLHEPDLIGRDKFLEIACELGLALPKPKNYQRTTFSYKSAMFKNLAATVNINDINAVWVSDITYFPIRNSFYYITFIMDVYSRRILGYCAADSLRAEESCKALNMAIKERAGNSLKNLIHHSDKGSQYCSKMYLGILEEHNIAVSMCNSVYENSHIERVNGIMKNEYLLQRNIKNYNDLCYYLDKDILHYNYSRPHWSIGCISPVEFEHLLTNVPLHQRTVLNLFSDNEIYNSQKYVIPLLLS